MTVGPSKPGSGRQTNLPPLSTFWCTQCKSTPAVVPSAAGISLHRCKCGAATIPTSEVPLPHLGEAHAQDGQNLPSRPRLPSQQSHWTRLPSLDIPAPLTPQTASSSGSSRHSSVSGTSGRSRRSDGSCSTKRRKGSSNSRTNAAKNAKERDHRSDLQTFLQMKQDILRLLDLPVGEKHQSAGNAASSGLMYPKIDIENCSIAVCAALLDDKFKQSLRTGRLGDFFNEIREIIERGRDDPLAGTLMEDTRSAYERAKRCEAHDHPDCKMTECRMAWQQVNFNCNKEQYIRSAGRPRTGGVQYP